MRCAALVAILLMIFAACSAEDPTVESTATALVTTLPEQADAGDQPAPAGSPAAERTPVPTWTPEPTWTPAPEPAETAAPAPTPLPTSALKETPTAVPTAAPVAATPATPTPVPWTPEPTPVPTPLPTPAGPGGYGTYNQVTRDHFTDKWAYVVEAGTHSQCGEHDGEPADLVTVIFGLEPDVTLMGWEDSLLLSLYDLDAGPSEIKEYWFTIVPGPGAAPVDTPDHVIMPSGFSYDGQVYEFSAVLTGLRHTIDNSNLWLRVHGHVHDREQLLRIIDVPPCQ